MAHPQDFDAVLQLFQKNLLEYKVTGNSAYKVAAENAQKWLDDYVHTLEKAASQDSQYITRFVKEYSDTNPELVKMRKQIQKVREQGPKLQDVLETEKRAEPADPPGDTSGFYVKSAVVGTALAIAAVASFLP